MTTPRHGLYADPAVLFARILQRVEVGPGGCLLFMGAVNSRGYSCVAAGKKGRTILGHRLAVIVRDGDIPDGLTVDHMCEVKRCVNAAHLQIVTRAENTRLRFTRHLPKRAAA